MEEILKSLNIKQKEAVISLHKRICVVAGPGCGKTRTLVSRVIYLLFEGKAAPEQILVLTFAKKAIKEIKKRISIYFESKHLKEISIFNFHSFCFSVMSSFSHLLGYDRNNFFIYDRKEQEEVLKKVTLWNDYAADDKEIFFLVNFISKLKIGKLDSVLSNFDPLIKKRYLIFQKYQNYLDENWALDFNDLILKTIELLEKFPEVRRFYSLKFRYILIDEFQDINLVQWRLINLILTLEQNIFLVGDPNQSIYGFQGSNPELIFKITGLDEWKKFYLNVNYRSTENLLNLTNSFIERNKESLINNPLISFVKKEGRKIKLSFDNSPRSIVREVLWLNKNLKINFNEIVILYRNNYLSSKIEQELSFNKIPYEVLGSFKFIEREEIKDVLAFVKLFLYDDNLSLLRTLKIIPSIGSKTLEKIEIESQIIGKKIYRFLQEAIFKGNLNEFGFSKLQCSNIENFIKKVFYWKEEIKEDNKKMTLVDFFRFFLEDFNYLLHLKARDSYNIRKENIEKFLNIVENWEKKKIRKEIVFLEKINLFFQWIIFSFQDSKALKTRDNLILSSIHQAKGLEFEVVFLIYLDQGIIPYKDAEDLIEEKRLFYVAITRAKNLLYLVGNSSKISPFLKEIDHQFLLYN